MSGIRWAEREYSDEEIYSILSEPVREWFKQKFGTFTPPPQRYAVLEIHRGGENVLISSPTGSGKTLSAFLSAINELILLGEEGKLEDKIYVLYVSPLRALNNDIKRNLEGPLAEIKKVAKELGYELPDIRVGIRTSDTSSYEKSKMVKKPPHILITTPESLAIALNAPKFSERLKTVKYVIIDEVHALAENKRGSHLALSVERLQEMADNEFVRIGLSATIHPLEEVTKFVFGFNDDGTPPRPGLIVDVSFAKQTEIKVESVVEDLIYTDAGTLSDALYNRLAELIREHRTTLIFTNTRSGAERVAFNLKKRFPEFEGLIEAHHSSLSREVRLDVEEKLKRGGELKAVVTSTSLELGIDIGTIDLVVLIGSPKSVNRALQRIGRAGHRLHDVSKGVILALDRDDLVEVTVLAHNARNRRLDRIRIPKNPLDVLVQHIVGMALYKVWEVEEAYRLVRRAYPFHELPFEDFMSVLKYLSGGYEGLEDRKVYAKIWLEDGKFGRRGKMTRAIYYMNVGTIPDEAKIRVYTMDKQMIGTVEEEFAERLMPGDIFVLAGRTYEFVKSRGGNKIYVVPREGAKPTIPPAWFSEMLPLSFDLALDVQRFRREVKGILNRRDAIRRLMRKYGIDERAAKAIIAYFREQERYSTVPDDETVLVEEVEKENTYEYFFHTLIGRRANDALSRAFAYAVSRWKGGVNVGIALNDNGFLLRVPKEARLSEAEVKELFQLEDLREILKRALDNTELLKRRFRHVANRGGFLILRRYVGGRKKRLGRQQVIAVSLLKVLKEHYPDFPLLKEVYREIMEDKMDVENAELFLSWVRGGKD